MIVSGTDSTSEVEMVVATREWTIADGVFQPYHSFEVSKTFDVILSLIEPIKGSIVRHGASLYVRGSVIEDRYPYANSDIDFFLVAEQGCHQVLHDLLCQRLQVLSNKLDILCLTKEEMEANLVFRLLVTTRSLLLAGEAKQFSPVLANLETAKAHWEIFQVPQLPDHLIATGSGNVCMVKQLLRSIALFYLLDQQRFSRHLYTCLQWGREMAPPMVFDILEKSFHHIGKKQSPPIDIRAAKYWVCHQWMKTEERFR